MKHDFPKTGDFIVVGEKTGYGIERVAEGISRELVSAPHGGRVDALTAARTLAREANTQAWAYELDNEYTKL